jgi:hypothetical protein
MLFKVFGHFFLDLGLALASFWFLVFAVLWNNRIVIYSIRAHQLKTEI